MFKIFVRRIKFFAKGSNLYDSELIFFEEHKYALEFQNPSFPQIKNIILETILQDMLLVNALFLQTVLQDSCKQRIAIARFLQENYETCKILASFD